VAEVRRQRALNYGLTSWAACADINAQLVLVLPPSSESSSSTHADVGMQFRSGANTGGSHVRYRPTFTSSREWKNVLYLSTASASREH
jgi:hypothetical protein